MCFGVVINFSELVQSGSFSYTLHGYIQAKARVNHLVVFVSLSPMTIKILFVLYGIFIFFVRDLNKQQY